MWFSRSKLNNSFTLKYGIINKNTPKNSSTQDNDTQCAKYCNPHNEYRRVRLCGPQSLAHSVGRCRVPWLLT